MIMFQKTILNDFALPISVHTGSAIDDHRSNIPFDLINQMLDPPILLKTAYKYEHSLSLNI